jgi:hypothetical protein
MTNVMDNPQFWPSILTLKEVAALFGVRPEAIQQRIRERRMDPAPMSGQRFLRSDIVRYLSDPNTLAQEWRRPKKAQQAAPPVIATGKVTEPVLRIEDLPIILTVRDLAAVLRVSTATIRKDVGQYDFVPPPIAAGPLRWSRFDLERYLDHAVQINQSREDEARRAAYKEERDRAHLQGDPIRTLWELDNAVEQLAVADGHVSARVHAVVVKGPVRRIRPVDIPREMLRHWRPVEDTKTQLATSAQPLSPAQAALTAEAIVKVARRLRYWVQAERPGVLV